MSFCLVTYDGLFVPEQANGCSPETRDKGSSLNCHFVIQAYHHTADDLMYVVTHLVAWRDSALAVTRCQGPWYGSGRRCGHCTHNLIRLIHLS